MEQLGIQPVLLIAQIVNFLLLVFLLNKFLYKPVLSMLAKRKKAIEESVHVSEKMKEEEQKLSAKQAKLMDATKKDALLLIEKAKKEAKEEAKAIIADAQKEALAIVHKKKEEMDSAFGLKEKELRAEAITIAAHMVERLLPKLLSGDKQKDLVTEQLRDIEKSGVQL